MAEIANPQGVWWRANTGAVTMPYTSGHPCGSKRRFVRFGVPGMSDIQGVFDGRAIFIECKSEAGQVSALQRAFGESITRAGGEYHIVRSIEDLEKAI